MWSHKSNKQKNDGKRKKEKTPVRKIAVITKKYDHKKSVGTQKQKPSPTTHPECDHKNSFEILGSHLQSLQIQWNPTKPGDIPWNSMKSCEILWNPMNWWNPMKSLETLGYPMKSYEILWIQMNLLKSFEIPWNPNKF